MGAETNDLDTMEEDFHRTNKTLREWEEEPDTSYEDTMDMASKYMEKYKGY